MTTIDYFFSVRQSKPMNKNDINSYHKLHVLALADNLKIDFIIVAHLMGIVENQFTKYL